MADQITMVALRDLDRDHGRVRRGDRYQTTAIQASIDLRRHDARFARASDLIVPAVPEDEPVPVRRRRGSYRRRDLRAEP